MKSAGNERGQHVVGGAEYVRSAGRGPHKIRDYVKKDGLMNGS